jgi:hypothetical protein
MIIRDSITLPLLAFTEADHWRPGIGDPTFMGWFTVVAYFIAMLLSWRAAQTSPFERGGSWLLTGRKFWWGMTALLLCLGINKQLDLQTWFTLTGKAMAKSEGWYERRRIFQVLFIATIGFGGIVSVAGVLWILRNRLKEFGLAMVGIIFLGCFIVVRAASFHHVDQLLLAEIGGLRINWILEVGGILWVGLAAWFAIKRNRTVRANAGTGFVWVTAGDRL